MTKIFGLVHAEARRRAVECVRQAPDGFVVVVREPTRNLEQNARLWAYLTAFSEQLLWPVNGERCRLTPEEWKSLLSAAFFNETQRIALGLNGGMVILGLRTSKMGKRQFSEFIEFIQATAIERGVILDNKPDRREFVDVHAREIRECAWLAP